LSSLSFPNKTLSNKISPSFHIGEWTRLESLSGLKRERGLQGKKRGLGLKFFRLKAIATSAILFAHFSGLPQDTSVYHLALAVITGVGVTAALLFVAS